MQRGSNQGTLRREWRCIGGCEGRKSLNPEMVEREGGEREREKAPTGDMAGDSQHRTNQEEGDDEEEEEGEGEWEDWTSEAGDGDDPTPPLSCLFCNCPFGSASLLFAHCKLEHSFDFQQARRDHSLDFYGCVRLLNFIRSRVAVKECWNCRICFDSQEALLEHLKTGNHVLQRSVSENNLKSESENSECCKLAWKDDRYLVPFLQDDALLYSFDEDLDDNQEPSCNSEMQDFAHGYENGFRPVNDRLPNESVMSEKSLVDMITQDLEKIDINSNAHAKNPGRAMMVGKTSDETLLDSNTVNGSAVIISSCNESTDDDKLLNSEDGRKKSKRKVSFAAAVAEKEIFNANERYFASYGTFGIHREMLGDKVRTEAYQSAIMKNPSLLEGAVVMDLGCGTGILSLFAAKAGAKRVLAVDGSEHMANIARNVAKANGFSSTSTEDQQMLGSEGVIDVIHGMIEELDEKIPVKAGEVDVLVSEWMGYCLLFESMLGSVLYARDRWLKPGGAILPDTASMYVAGFGCGGTSLPFWENVYGFNMSCIGQEVLEHSSESPIIDIIESKDIITDTCLLQRFDLANMKPEDVDFNTMVKLKLSEEHASKITWCYGLVLWFDTGFTERFCKENPVLLSTSPYKAKTHWSQTLLTFKEPVALGPCCEAKESLVVGSELNPGMALQGRISIARSLKHRSIDISLEMSTLGSGGKSRMMPIQLFDI